MSTVCTDEQIELYRDLGCSLLVMPKSIILSGVLRLISLFDVGLLFKPSGLLVEVCTCQLMIEVQRDVGQLFQGVKKALVETRTVYCLDVLGSVKYHFQAELEREGHTLPFASYS